MIDSFVIYIYIDMNVALLEFYLVVLSMPLAGNCDNCIVSKKERDMSKEAFLLLACIQSCRSKWGLNMPVDILRGSRVSS